MNKAAYDLQEERGMGNYNVLDEESTRDNTVNL